MNDLIGQQWGSYRLAHLLNHGSSADVYVGYHVRFQTSATIEIFHVQLAGESMTVFLSEARTFIQLIHAHILRLLDFDIQEGHPFFVLDSAPGSLLSQRYPYGTRVPLVQVIEYSQQVASALQYAHDLNIVHGNVQPEHMLLSKQNEILLSGFGIPIITRLLAATNAQVPAEVLACRAPEQAQGQLLPASDQYALGVAVYQWLCGVWPFQGRPVELVAQHLSRQPPPLHQYVPGISNAVEQVVLQALAKDPAGRFASVQAFAQALEQAGQNVVEPSPASPVFAMPQIAPPPPADSFQTIRSSPTTTHVQTTQPVSRRGLLVAGAVVAGLVLVGGAGLFIAKNKGSQGTITGSPAGSLVYVYQGQQSPLVGEEDDNSVAILWSADSKRMLSIGGKDGAFQCWDAFTGAHISTYHPLLKTPDTTGISNTVRWTQQDPLQIWVDGTVIHVTDIVTSQDMYTADATAVSPDGIEEIFWSPDGSLFAALETNYASQTVPSLIGVYKGTDGSRVSSFHRQYTSASTDDWIHEKPDYLVWSPDSTRILAWGEDNLLYIWNASTGALIFTNEKYTKAQQVVDSGGVAWSPDGKYITSSQPDTLDIWKATDGSVVSTFALPNSSGVTNIAWSPDSQMLAILAYGNLHILVPGSNTPLFTHDYSNLGEFISLAWSPDSKRLAGNSWTSSVLGGPVASSPTANPLFTVWDARTGQHAVNYADSDQNNTTMTRLLWSPDGKYIATQRTDAVVEIWKAS